RQRLLTAFRLMKDGRETDWNLALSWFLESAEERRQARNRYLQQAGTIFRELGENPKDLPRRIIENDLPEPARDLVRKARVCWRIPKSKHYLSGLLQ
ncbi:MAG: hypothetical protein KDI50_06020, partial [Candidatus Competibacteraceae bacterium]|nr:hypothetical protein [Candidatus Competibacteraceae bacterium]